MKVLIYTEYFFPIPGGVQTIVRELASGLAASKKMEPGDSAGVTVVTRTTQRIDNEKDLPFRLVRGPSFTEFIPLIREADIVHLAGPALLPMALCLVFRKPMVVEHHGYQSICPNGLLLYGPDGGVCPGHFMAGRYGQCIRCNTRSLGWKKSLRDLLLTFPRRWMCQLASRNIAVTNHVSRRLALPRTDVIYHGIADHLVSSPRLPTTNADGEPVRIGYVGRLVSEKGLVLLLRAAKRLDDDGLNFQLTFVGGGSEQSAIENLARGLAFKNPVVFLGELSGEALENATRAIQVVVMPSEWEETAGLAAIEQMMRGGAVIAADIGGLGEVVADAGLRFAARDVNALYKCLRQVVESSELRRKLGAASRTRAEGVFGLDDMIEKHLSVYREISS